MLRQKLERCPETARIPGGSRSRKLQQGAPQASEGPCAGTPVMCFWPPGLRERKSAFLSAAGLAALCCGSPRREAALERVSASLPCMVLGAGQRGAHSRASVTTRVLNVETVLSEGCSQPEAAWLHCKEPWVRFLSLP